MVRTSESFLDRLIERLDQLDSSSVQGYVLKLVRERGFLETVFNTIREGVIIIDRDLSIHYCNPAARAMLGIPDDFGEHPISRFLRDISWSRLMRADPEQWDRISMQEIEVYYPEHRHLSFYLVPVWHEREGGDDIPLASIILHDITELHRDAVETVESEKVQAITRLAAGVAHEIGNPLNSLHIHLQLLKRNVERAARQTNDPDGDNSGELVDIALQEVQRLDSIVGNFLRAVRPVEPNFRPVAVDELVQETLTFMRREIEDRDVLVEASWPDTLPRIKADPDLLKQAFYNILKNAIQAMPDGGVLRIGCREDEQTVEVRFADSGIGISREDLHRITEPYFTTRSGGTGLGMMIVERIMRTHGGELGIESEEGEGTVFTLRFPLHSHRIRLLKPPDEDRQAESKETNDDA